MKQLLIIWHSTTGGSAQMARAAFDAARATVADVSPGPGSVQVRLQRAVETTAEHVLAADGYLFCAPEHLASLAGPMKDFFDRCYYSALDRVNGRPYGLLVCAGSDGTGAVRQVERICVGWRLKQAAPALIVNTRAQSPQAILAPKVIAAAELARCSEVGATLAAGLSAGIL